MTSRPTRRRLGHRAAVLALVALVVAAGSAAQPRHTSRVRLTVLAASSLATVLPQIDRSPRYSFGGSDTLAAQIRLGAPADVFAAASSAIPDTLYAEGFVERPVVFTTNTLVLVTPRANPARIRSVFDLRRSGIKLVIGTASVPIGVYTRTVLKKLGLAGALADVVSEEADVRSILGKVALGEADAGFVYATDARTVAGRVNVIGLPAWAQPAVRYEIAVVKPARNRAAARAFVGKVLSKTGQAKLRAAGFGPLPQAAGG